MCAGSDFQESSIGEFKIDIPIHDPVIEALHSPTGFLKKEKKMCRMSAGTEM